MVRGVSPASGGEFACTAVLFDLDGVLVFSAESVRRSWTAWAIEHHIEPEIVLAAAGGRRSVDTIRHVAPRLDAEAEAALLESGQALDVADVAAAPGARALLDGLAAHEWAVVTSGSSALAAARLAAAGLPEPQVFVTAERVAEGKPDPAGYLLAAELLALPAAGCLVVEDAPAGVEAARRAGMRVIGIANEADPATLAAADTVAGVFAELRVLRPDSPGLVVAVSGAGAP